jgi:acetolactate synthase I/II/III large subunit
MTSRRGADALVEALCAAGCRTVFALSGNHIMSVFDAALDRDIRLVHTRHEAAAVHMADAFARLSGGLGVALVTAGQGHANAAAALATAQAGETPLLLLSGHAPVRELGLGSFQEQDQAALAAPLTKASWMVQSAANLPQDIAKAGRIALSGRPGPVHLSLPADLLEAECQIAAPDAGVVAGERLRLPEATAQLVLATIEDARRPLVIAPPALTTASGRLVLRDLREALGVPVFAMESPRGVNDPSLGALAEVLGEADVVVLLAKPLDFTLRFGRAAPAARWVVIEPDAALLQRAARLLGERLVLGALADAEGAAEALRALASGEADAGWTHTVETALAWRPPEWASIETGKGPLHPVTLFRAVQPFLERDEAVLVSDGGEIGQWAQALLHAPNRVINGVAGAIGPSIPFALGAKAARPKSSVVAVLGDGTFGFHMAELETAARENLPFVAIVGNDSRWNAEHQIQRRTYGEERARGCTLSPAVRYDLVAAALGGHGELVTRAAELPDALSRAFASGKPACVNVLSAGLPAPVIKRA